MVTPGGQPKGEGDCGCLAQYNQDCSGQVGFVSHGRLLTQERGTQIISPWAGEACKPRSATHLGEGNSEVKPTAQAPRCHRPGLLGHGRLPFCLKGGASLCALYFTWKFPSKRTRPRFLRPTIPKALQWWERGGSGSWKMLLEAVVSILHVGSSGLWLAGC